MYTEHPTFTQPENENIKIWRFMDFTKFVSLISTSNLYFARADKLNDPFEGSLPKQNILEREVIPNIIPPEMHKVYLEHITKLGGIFKQMPKHIAINSWHINEHESAAMWKLYSKSDEGVAIQTTYHKFKNSIIDKEIIYLGKVNYINYETDRIDARVVFSPFIHKRLSFQYEQEVRAIAHRMPMGKDGIDFRLPSIENGLFIKTDINILIEYIYMSPTSSDWFEELLHSVISHYGYTFVTKRSKLNEQPLY